MPNGDFLEQVDRIFERDGTIPQGTSNGLIIASLKYVYRELKSEIKEIREVTELLTSKVASLENRFNENRLINQEKDKIRDERSVTWPYLWENFGKDLVKFTIVAVLTYVLVRAGIMN